MGIHLRVLSKSYPMNTNMTGLRWFFQSIGRVNYCKPGLSYYIVSADSPKYTEQGIPIFSKVIF